MTFTRSQRIGIFIVLALIMAGTRINHFSALPDASWAAFFAAGFYLRGSARWAFPALLATGVVVDLLVISSTGTSFWNHYCMSAAYWFMALAYAAMWLGGSLVRKHGEGLGNVPKLALLGAIALLATNVCFLISNGSFYWLADSVPLPRSFDAWFTNMGHWYLGYLKTSMAYIGFGALVHAIVASTLGARQGARVARG